MTEKWRIIPSLPEYIACNDGRVMRLPFIGEMPYGGDRHYGGEPTTGTVHPLNNMRPTILYKSKNYRVSRLICEAFHGPAPFPKAVVMHINDDQTDNRAENLKWGTQKENLNSARFIAYCRSRTGENNPIRKHIAKLNRKQA